MIPKATAIKGFRAQGFRVQDSGFAVGGLGFRDISCGYYEVIQGPIQGPIKIHSEHSLKLQMLLP